MSNKYVVSFLGNLAIAGLLINTVHPFWAALLESATGVFAFQAIVFRIWRTTE